MRARATGPDFSRTDSCRSSTEVDPFVCPKCGAEDEQQFRAREILPFVAVSWLRLQITLQHVFAPSSISVFLVLLECLLVLDESPPVQFLLQPVELRALGWDPVIATPVAFPALAPGAVISGLPFSILIALLAGGLTEMLFTGPVPDAEYELFGFASLLWVPLIFLVLRVFASFLTIGSGMSAGLAHPAVQAGTLAALAVGATLSGGFGYGLVPVFTVIGVSGMLPGSMNAPLASAVLAIELFGPSYGTAGAVAAVISFPLNRNNAGYDRALAGSGHNDSNEETPTGNV